MIFERFVCALGFCLVAAVAGVAQSADLPAAPAAATSKPEGKSIFTLPPTDFHASATANHPAPKTPDETEQCFAPANGLYAPQPKLSAKQEEAKGYYVSTAQQHLATEWFHHMPRAANDPWLKGAQVVIRFAILPDGSIDTPLVTVSSGRASYDKHGLDAIYAANPFAPLPDGVPWVGMCMHFKYNTSEPYQKPIELWPPPAKPAS
jgi:TonB family protein